MYVRRWTKNITGDCCCGSDCHDHGHGPRKVLTKAEKVEKLTNYAEELKKEQTEQDVTINVKINKILEKDAKNLLDATIIDKNLETNLNVERQTDQLNVKSYLDNNLKNLIRDALKGM